MFELYVLKGKKAAAEKALGLVNEPFIFNAGTLDNDFLRFHAIYTEDYPVKRLIHDTLSKETGKRNIWDIAKIACSEDTKWGEERNAGLTGKFYYKYTLKPKYAKKVTQALTNYLKEVKAEERKVKREEDIQNKKIELERKKYDVTKVIKLIHPKGGEMGVDGYSDLILKNKKDGKTVRMVERNVFDFGYYVYPKRLEGGAGVFNQGMWTEDERNAGPWLKRFGPLKDKRVRM